MAEGPDIEKLGEKLPVYRPTLVAGSDAEAARLRETFPAATSVKVDIVGTDRPTDATSRIRLPGMSGINGVLTEQSEEPNPGGVVAS